MLSLIFAQIMLTTFIQRTFICLLIVLFSAGLKAQTITIPAEKKSRHTFYVSWGYNTEWYTNSTVHVKQESLGNDYQLNNVRGHDHKGWDETSLFKQALTIPQYNYRIGYMDEQRGMGIEINFDHTKYIIEQDQDINITGQIGDRTMDTTIRYSNSNGFYYFLNNGANFFLINFVKRWHLYHDKQDRIRIDGLGKIGVGPVVPHVENSFFGKNNKPGFQIGGWNTGIEGDLKATFYKYVYLEYGAKFDYARYSNLAVYEGKARQSFGTFEMILSLVVNIPGRKK